MTNATLVQLKVDSEIKEDVSRIYENLGLDLPTAIRIFFKKSIAVGGLPFELREESTRWKIYDQVRKSNQLLRHPLNEATDLSNFRDKTIVRLKPY